VSVVCEVIACARSSYSHRPQPAPDAGWQGALEEVAAAWPRYGYRRVTQQLRREGWIVNHKRVARMMHDLGLQAQRKPKSRTTTTDSRHAFPRYPNLVEHLEVVRPEQLWVSDITAIALREECVAPFRADGCLYALYSRLAPGAQSRSASDLASAGAGTGPVHAGDSSLRSGCPVCGHCVDSTLASRWDTEQYGRSGSRVAKWVCRAADANHPATRRSSCQTSSITPMP
jgi:hypothetical protein